MEITRSIKTDFKTFLNGEKKYHWKDSTIWNYGTGTMDCYYEADITLKLDPNVFRDSKLKQILQKNLFLDRDTIIQYFEKSLEKALDKEFIYYCTREDYYEPVVEDFEIDSVSILPLKPRITHMASILYNMRAKVMMEATTNRNRGSGDMEIVL